MSEASEKVEQGWWQAVLARDGSKDGVFYYAVASTGVYCRPSCPARRPRREHVRFFERREEAEGAGFRPCRRCRPAHASVESSGVVAEVCEFIGRNLEEDLRLTTLSRRFGLSPFQLQRAFKRALGITPREYADTCRLQSLKSQLQDGDTVTDALYGAGYGSSSRLYERTNSQLGMTPATYRRGGEGVMIRYTFVDSPIGRMMLAATDKGICSIAFGESETRLVQGLRREYPKATLKRGDAVLRGWIGGLLKQMHDRQPPGELPVDVRATVFQRRVWEHLRSIPYGQTRSYAQVASAIGKPTAVRAVARACATNPVAVAIPCHRVLRTDGSLGGYRWGLERKRKLLEIERARAAGAAEQSPQ
ncbi:MAG TPA: bifunctional DNA-binding transcriptional regulator/O6-methylguanine-DNA methyltransferase Ada [Terriglobales bacterium]|nr:bifunctional DNA-binding transcriptional regulator/O6-methylguanine-DNA methyltransferase Ada [Terriglobales bacterium]